MPTILGHAIAATAAAQWWRRVPPPFWTWTVACSMLPDADVISFSFGIRYEDMFGHRGFTHSLFFAAIAGLVAAVSVRGRAHAGGPAEAGPYETRGPAHSLGVRGWSLGVLWVWFMAITASHGLLDAMTNGGRGIAFFAPFSNHRYFFPWRPIQVSPIGIGFFSARGLRVLASESLWIWLPSAIMATSARLWRGRTWPPSPKDAAGPHRRLQ
jgi:inner membrane protein